jgi:hypothetical protein
MKTKNFHNVSACGAMNGIGKRRTIAVSVDYPRNFPMRNDVSAK